MSRLREVQDQAAAWILAREDGEWDESREAEFASWLDSTDLHRIAYLRLQQGWREADRIVSLGSRAEGEILAALEAEERDFASPGQRGQADAESARYRGTPTWMGYAAAILLLVSLGGAWAVFKGASAQPGKQAEIVQIETDVGTRKLVNLTDGSRVELNTASALRAGVDERSREVWLDKGEAYFEIAHDPAHPFVVHAGSHRITVLGTKFSVRRNGDKIAVVVREGRVRVDDLEAQEVVRSTVITGGDVALTRGAATMVTSDSDEHAEDRLAWRGGMLNFQRKRLDEVAAEFNRYNRRQLVVTDPAAAAIRISGSYPADKPGEFVSLLRDAYGLSIEETGDTIKIAN